MPPYHSELRPCRSTTDMLRLWDVVSSPQGHYAILRGCGTHARASLHYPLTMSYIHPLPWKRVRVQGFLWTGFQNSWVHRGLNKTSSRGASRCSARWNIQCPMLKSTSILGLHLTKTLHPGIYPWYLYPTSHGKCLGSTSPHDLSHDSSYIPARSTRPSPYIQNTRQDLPMSVIRFYGTTCLIWSQQPSTRHHITNIMHSRVTVVRGGLCAVKDLGHDA